MINSLLLLLFILFPLGQLIKIPLLGRVSVLPQEIVLAVLIVIFVAKNGFKAIIRGPLVKEIFFFLLVVFLSLILSPLRMKPLDLVESIAYLIRFLLYFGLFVICVEDINRGGLKRSFLIKGLILSSLVFCFFGFAQFFFFPILDSITYLGWDIHHGRMVSTFLDPGFSGLVFILGFFLVLGQKYSTKLTILLESVYLISLLLTFSRSSYLVFIFGLAIYGVMQKKVKIIAVITGLLLLGIIFVPKPSGEGGNLLRTVSTFARVGDWQISLAIWQHSPIFGIGFNSYRIARETYGYVPPNRPETVLSGEGNLVNHSLGGADNSFLLVLATSGILGLAIFLNLWRKVVFSLNNEYKTIILASFGAIFLHTIFQNSLFYPHIMEWIWILMAIGVKAPNTSHAS